MLAQREADLESLALQREQQGWTAIRVVDRVLLDRLEPSSSQWSQYSDPRQRDAAFQRFKDYAYQWY